MVSTDHCPFCFKAQKEMGLGDFSKIPNGLPGVEHRMDLLHQGVVDGHISRRRWIELACATPARMFGLYPRKGTIAPGADADVVVYDPAATQVLSAATHHMNVDYSCYEGREITGQVRTVLSRGRVVVDGGEYRARPGTGGSCTRDTCQYLSRDQIMDIGLVLQTDPPGSAVVDLMVRAEELGFSHGWTFDSHVLWQEPYVILSQVLARTSRLVVGPMVTNPATRDWTVIASLHATLNEMHGNRTVCGIGRGDSAVRVQGRKPTTLARLARRGARDPGAGRGPAGRRRGHVDPGSRGCRPGRGCRCGWPATGPKALELTGRCADGFILQLADPYLVEWTVKSVRAAAEAAGRDPDALTICVAAPAYVGDDLAHARDQCRWFGGMVGNHVADLVTRYGESGAVPAELTGYIKDREGYDYSHHGKAGNPSTTFVPDEVVDRFCLLGPPSAQLERLAELRGAGRGPVRDLRDARRPGGDDRGVREVGDPRLVDPGG